MAPPRRAPRLIFITMKNETEKHPWQRVLDNPWLLLVLGVLIPILSYTVWGWIELLFTKPALLP